MSIVAILFFMLFSPLTLFIGIVGICKNPINWRKYMPFLIISIFVLAYSYIPIGTPDLTRYRDIVMELQGKHIKQAIEYMNDGLYLENIYFWLIAKIGDIQLLAAIPFAIVYSISTYVTCDSAQEYNMQKKIPFLLICQFMLLPFFSILNNVRCITAFSLIILATYLDLVKGKKNIGVLLLYALPCFYHSAGIIIILLRISIILAKKIQYLIICGIFVLPYLVDLLYERTSNLGNIVIRTLISKVYWYFHDDFRSEYSKRMAISGANVVQKILFSSLAILIIIIIFKKNKNVKNKYKDFQVFIFLICISVLGCMPVNTPQYWRFTAAVIISGIGPIFSLILKENKKNLFRQTAISSIVLISFGGLLIQIWNSRYIVDYLNWLSNFVLSNIYVIIIKFIKLLL